MEEKTALRKFPVAMRVALIAALLAIPPCVAAATSYYCAEIGSCADGRNRPPAPTGTCEWAVGGCHGCPNHDYEYGIRRVCYESGCGGEQVGEDKCNNACVTCQNLTYHAAIDCSKDFGEAGSCNGADCAYTAS